MATRTFQIIDLISDDVDNQFCITIYGKDINHKNIACHVINYLPHFYFKIPDHWSSSDAHSLLKRICKKSKTIYYKGEEIYKLWEKKDIIDSLRIGTAKHRSKVVSGKEFYNLSWNKEINNGNGGIQEFKFYKACFTNLRDMKKVITEIRKFYNKCLWLSRYRWRWLDRI